LIDANSRTGAASGPRTAITFHSRVTGWTPFDCRSALVLLSGAVQVQSLPAGPCFSHNSEQERANGSESDPVDLVERTSGPDGSIPKSLLFRRSCTSLAPAPPIQPGRRRWAARRRGPLRRAWTAWDALSYVTSPAPDSPSSTASPTHRSPSPPPPSFRSARRFPPLDLWALWSACALKIHSVPIRSSAVGSRIYWASIPLHKPLLPLQELLVIPLS